MLCLALQHVLFLAGAAARASRIAGASEHVLFRTGFTTHYILNILMQFLIKSRIQLRNKKSSVMKSRT